MALDEHGLKLHIAIAHPAAERLGKCDLEELAGAGPSSMLEIFRERGCTRPVMYLFGSQPICDERKVRHYWLSEHLDYDTHPALTFAKWLGQEVLGVEEQEMRRCDAPLQILNECSYVPARVVSVLGTTEVEYRTFVHEQRRLASRTSRAQVSVSRLLPRTPHPIHPIGVGNVVGKHWDVVFPGYAPRVDQRFALADAYNEGDWATLAKICYKTEGVASFEQLREAARAHAAPGVRRP